MQARQLRCCVHRGVPFDVGPTAPGTTGQHAAGLTGIAQEFFWGIFNDRLHCGDRLRFLNGAASENPSGEYDVPINCKFKLNKQDLSMLEFPGVGSFAAFSGSGKAKNDPDAAYQPGAGPLPPGRYYVTDRGGGGIFTHILDGAKDIWADTNRSAWFALYRDDGKIDDETFVNGVRRSNFRLHPHGRFNISEGCITLASLGEFNRLRSALLKTVPLIIPSGTGRAYGIIDVTQ